MESPPGQGRARALGVHRRDLTQDQHGNIARLGSRGKRLKAHAPYGHWKTLSFIATMRQDRIDAPWVIDGPISGEFFRLYVEKVLASTLSPGDVVVLDKLGIYKCKAARAPVKARGAHLIFLPA